MRGIYLTMLVYENPHEDCGVGKIPIVFTAADEYCDSVKCSLILRVWARNKYYGSQLLQFV